MSEVILASVAVALTVTVAFAVIHTLARRSAPATEATPFAVRGAPVAEPPCGSGEHIPLPDPNEWQSATVSDLMTAEDLLDRAEAEGYAERELIVLDNDTFLVRWRRLETRRQAPE